MNNNNNNNENNNSLFLPNQKKTSSIYINIFDKKVTAEPGI